MALASPSYRWHEVDRGTAAQVHASPTTTGEVNEDVGWSEQWCVGG
jgi:hypothetical protein